MIRVEILRVVQMLIIVVKIMVSFNFFEIQKIRIFDQHPQP